jgi:outer membrane protein assembly factor BamB
MLTGTLPFQGESLVDLLERVKTQEPVAPRKLVPELSRDAETIVMKALEKDRARRYATAQELADDIERYLRGEAIHARPAGWWYRLRKAAARRPALSAAAGVVAAAALAAAAYALGPAWVDVACATPGARVVIDGRESAPGPRAVWPGWAAEARVVADGHEPIAESLRLYPWTRAPWNAGRLREDSGDVSVTIVPADAGVELVQGATRIAGLPGGTWTRRLRNGTWQMRISAPGHVAVEDKGFTVYGGGPLDLGVVRLEREFGYLTIDSNSDASVALYRSTEPPRPLPLPCRLADVPRDEPFLESPIPADRLKVETGTYLAVLSKPGHFPKRCVVRVERAVERPAREVWDLGVGRPVVSPGHTWVRAWLEPMQAWEAAGGRGQASPRFGDLNGDGVLDVVSGAQDRRIRALSGADGSLLWSVETGGPIQGAPCVADLDGDGVPDVVVCGDDGVVSAWSGRAGRALWVHRMPMPSNTTVTAADLDGDGRNEVVLPASDQRIRVLRGRDGAEVWASREFPKVCASVPPVADVDGDGVLDVLAWSQGEAAALSGRDGRDLWRVPVPGGSFGGVAARLDGDAVPDLLVPGTRIVALSGADGRRLWTAPEGPQGPGIACADVNRDGAPDAVAICGHQDVRAFSGRDGAELWKWKAPGPLQSVAAGDVDGDGVPEFAFGSAYGAVYLRAGADGSALWEFEAGSVPSGLRLDDLDGDGVVEIVFGTRDARILAFHASPGAILWRNAHPSGTVSPPRTADADGDGVPDGFYKAFDRLRAVSGADGRALWTSADDPSPPSVADFDGDGRFEVVYGSKGRLKCRRAADGTLVWDTAEAGEIWVVVPLPDVDGDGARDILTGGSTGAVQAFSSSDGRRLWRCPTDGPVSLFLRSADLDGDGSPEALAGSHDFHLHAIDGRSGNRLWKFRTNNRVVSAVAVAHANGDGAPDCFLSSQDGAVYGVDGRTGALLWRFEAEFDPHLVTPAGFVCPEAADLDGDGRPDAVLATCDRRLYALAVADGRLLWSFAAGRELKLSRRLADLDGDGSPDVIASSQDARIFGLSARDGALLWTLRAEDNAEWIGDLDDLDADSRPDAAWFTVRNALLRVRIPAARAKNAKCGALEARRWEGHGLWEALVRHGDAADPRQLLTLGRACLGLGRRDEAVALLDRAAAAFPGDPVAPTLAAAASGDPRRLEDALRLDPEAAFHAAAEFRLFDDLVAPASAANLPAGSLAAAVAAALAGRWDVAASSLEPHIAGRPELLRVRAHIAFESGDAEAALRDAATLDRLGLRFPEQRAFADRARDALADPRKKALALAKGNRREDAFPWFEKALKTWPDDAELLNAYAWYLATLRWPSKNNPSDPAPTAETARALELALRAVELAGDSPRAGEYLDTLAAALYSEGKVKQAVEMQEKALEEGTESLKAEMKRRLERYRERLGER